MSDSVRRLAVGEPVDVHGWGADAATAARFLGEVDFHRLGFQLVEAYGPLPRRGDAVPVGERLMVDFVRNASVRRAFIDRVTGSALRHVSEAFAAAGVDWVVMKGPALLAYTPDSETRDYRDLDVLVTGQSLQTALDALEGAGALLTHRNFDMLGAIVSGEFSLAMPGAVSLDLHWHPMHLQATRAAFRLDPVDLIRRSRPAASDQLPYPTLDPHDNLIYVAVHAGLSGGYRLLWVRDILNALRHSAWDPDIVVHRAREARVALVVAVVLDHVADLADVGQARALADQLVGRSPWRTLLRGSTTMERRIGAARRPTWGLYRNTRGSTWRSALAYATSRRRTARVARGGIPLPSAAPTEREQQRLLIDTGAASRRRYLDAVAREADAITRSKH